MLVCAKHRHGMAVSPCPSRAKRVHLWSEAQCRTDIPVCPRNNRILHLPPFSGRQECLPHLLAAALCNRQSRLAQLASPCFQVCFDFCFLLLRFNVTRSSPNCPNFTAMHMRIHRIVKFHHFIAHSFNARQIAILHLANK
jgi:hypothetical protein